MKEGRRGGDGGLEVLCQAAITAEPGEASLDHPAPWMHGGADLGLRLAHDIDGDAGGVGDPTGGVTGIRKGFLNKPKAGRRRSQQRDGVVVVLHRGRMALQHQGAAIGVALGMPLAAIDFLARVVAARPTRFGGLGALAVDDHGRRAGSRPTRSRSSMTR